MISKDVQLHASISTFHRANSETERLVLQRALVPLSFASVGCGRRSEVLHVTLSINLFSSALSSDSELRPLKGNLETSESYEGKELALTQRRSL